MKFLLKIQKQLEDIYGASTGLDVTEFVRPYSGKTRKGELLVEQSSNFEDINLALLLDRDILAAWDSSSTVPKSYQDFGVPFEEVSHFVYLAYNHNRGRSVTQLEMEIQAEVDRVLMAFHGALEISKELQVESLEQLFYSPYSQGRYEEARLASLKFVKSLAGGDPRAWTHDEFLRLRDFFHNDLAGKMRLARK